MQISTRFTIAMHMLAAIAAFQEQTTISSTVLADSVNVNPVEIRRIMLQLSDAGIIHVKKGRGGITMAKKPEDISFLDVFYAVEALDEGELFRFHENPNPDCPIGKNIHNMLDSKLTAIQQSMERAMHDFTLKDVLDTPVKSFF